jgi:hypothetical protein
MTFDFASGITVGGSADLFERQRSGGAESLNVPSSGLPRGLSLVSLRVTGVWDRLWNLLGRRQQVYFLSVALDLSENEPVVLPPKEVPEGALYRVRRGEAVEFTLGDGAPIFLPREIRGGLVVYITVCEADRGARHVGEVMAKVHEDLTANKSLTSVIRGFITNPSATVADELLSAATAALQPVATILQSNGDDYEALFTGVYPAKGPWDDRLKATQNSATIELRELR